MIKRRFIGGIYVFKYFLFLNREVGIAVFFPFLLTFGVLSFREMYFENRRA